MLNHGEHRNPSADNRMGWRGECLCSVHMCVWNHDGATSTPAPCFIFIIYNYLAISNGEGTADVVSKRWLKFHWLALKATVWNREINVANDFECTAVWQLLCRGEGAFTAPDYLTHPIDRTLLWCFNPVNPNGLWCQLASVESKQQISLPETICK